MGGPDFSVDSLESLLIESPSGNETGEFICTATNAAGFVSRKVQLTVYGKVHAHRALEQRLSCLIWLLDSLCVCAQSVLDPGQSQMMPQYHLRCL